MKHIRSVLLQKEDVEQDEEWVLDEAMNGKKLQSGGTFRNVLSRKLDEVITPIFAEVLQFVDHYCNLDLVRKSSPPHVRQLWLSAFGCQELCHFSYEEMRVGGQRKSLANEFCCQFPFFWLVRDVVDSHWDNTVSITGSVTEECR